jgi:hypothetical protein
MQRNLRVYAAGAVAIAAGVQSSRAALVVTPLNSTVPADGFTDITFDGTTTRDFSVANNADGVWLKNSKAGIEYASASTTANSATALTSSTVSSALTFAPTNDNVFLVNVPGHGSTVNPTNFPDDGSTQYLGFELPDSGSPTGFDYGYLSLQIMPSASTPGDFTTNLIEYAYDNSGAPVPVPVPEPASLGLLAIGAAATMMRRRSA